MDSHMCRNCKEFFGCQDGLCSKCFKLEKLKSETIRALPELISAVPPPVEETKQPPPQVIHDPDRCWTCKKVVGPLSFQCKCQHNFCSRHRVPEVHGCTFDHRTVGIRKLSEDNPQIVAEKFNKLR
mmetsp:Transcript_671/g.713  ORF Transcript_671/g.713 Transcript_671/m.713 type:complete len:126 (+) Transcript_671:2-379(+)